MIIFISVEMWSTHPISPAAQTTMGPLLDVIFRLRYPRTTPLSGILLPTTDEMAVDTGCPEFCGWINSLLYYSHRYVNGICYKLT